MKNTSLFLPAGMVGLVLALAACEPVSPATGDTLQVFKSFGTTQCNPHDGRMDDLARELDRAGVTVLDRQEGDDGMMRITLCGSPDGRIGIFTIPAAQAGTAASAGFQPLT
ncbi:MAG: hypothetical protein Q4G26_05865 [Paracoccus sp. (in: a-proteobacteria)]|nr:hypothetical protein [Paracoccus sp. (in: a-proteobacteria)]